MKAPMRAALVGAVALALVAMGIASGAPYALAQAPSLSNVTLTPSPADEGQIVTVSGSFAAPEGGSDPSITVSWGAGQAVDFIFPGSAATSFAITHVYRDDNPTGTPQDTYTVTVTLDDGTGLNPPAVQTFTLVVRNVAPSVTMTTSSASVLDHDTLNVSGAFTDPGTLDTFGLSLDWGDGTAPFAQSYSAAAPKTFAASHQYLTPGSYTVTATVTDDDAGAGVAQASLLVSPRNTPPSNLVLSLPSVVEGTTATLTGSFADPDAADTHGVVVDWGDSTGTSSLSLGAGVLTFSATHVYASAGAYSAAITVTDLASASVSGTTSVTVLPANHAPSALVLTGSVAGNTATLTGTFADPDVADTHSVLVGWGDGSPSMTLSLGAGVLAFATSHAYASPGTYTLTVAVTDPAGAHADGTTSLTLVAPTVTDLLADLRAIVEAMPIDDGARNSLLSKVDGALAAVVKGADTCNALKALSNEVSAQTGKNLTAEQSTLLGDKVRAIQVLDRCTGAGSTKTPSGH